MSPTPPDELVKDQQLLGRVLFWAACNWMLDAAALWVFILAPSERVDIDVLIIVFGIANVLAVIPITPGGLGYVDTGLHRDARRLRDPAPAGDARCLASYRLRAVFFPILLGGILYLTLRVGPWSIERRDRLKRLRDVAVEETRRGETKIEFGLRFGTRPVDDQEASSDDL